MNMVISALLIIGSLSALLGSFGLLKFREPIQRLHAPTKTTTLGSGAILIAAALSGLGAKYLLIAGFLFLSAPLTALFIAKAIRHKSDRS